MKLAFILDDLSSIKIHKDSSYAMMREASTRGHAIFALYSEDLVYKNGVVSGLARILELEHSTSSNESWYRIDQTTQIPLHNFDAVFMRKDPPFDMEYVYSTYLLELAENQGARIINRPRAIRDFNEKLSIAKFPQFTAPTMVTSQIGLILDFLVQHHDIIVKPLDGMGGTSVFRVQNTDYNLHVILETLTQYNTRTIMAQRYIPEINLGDKRILLIAGKAVPYSLARIPKFGETRGNLAAGGRGVVQPLTEHDQVIADTLGPELYKQGLYLVGLDVIGNYLTEINVTSPTGMQEITNQSNFNVAGMMIDAVEALCH